MHSVSCSPECSKKHDLECLEWNFCRAWVASTLHCAFTRRCLNLGALLPQGLLHFGIGSHSLGPGEPAATCLESNQLHGVCLLMICPLLSPATAMYSAELHKQTRNCIASSPGNAGSTPVNSADAELRYPTWECSAASSHDFSWS